MYISFLVYLELPYLNLFVAVGTCHVLKAHDWTLSTWIEHSEIVEKRSKLLGHVKCVKHVWCVSASSWISVCDFLWTLLCVCIVTVSNRIVLHSYHCRIAPSFQSHKLWQEHFWYHRFPDPLRCKSTQKYRLLSLRSNPFNPFQKLREKWFHIEIQNQFRIENITPFRLAAGNSGIYNQRWKGYS